MCLIKSHSYLLFALKLNATRHAIIWIYRSFEMFIFSNNSKLEILEPGTMDWLMRTHRSDIQSILWNVDFTCALVADRETDGVMDIFSPFWSFFSLIYLVGEIFHPISSLCLHFLPARLTKFVLPC